MKARALLIWWVLWSSPVWLGAGTVELLTADAELRLEAARAMAHNVVATEPTSSTAIAAAAWWIERVEFLAEPAALAELVHPPADPELTYLVAQVDASVHNRTPAMVLRRADLSGPFGAFDTLDLARWTMPADRELPPLPTPWSSESEPFRLAAERMDGWIVPPPAMLRPGVYLASWPLRVPEEWSGWLVVEAEGSFELEADGRLVDHQQRCGELAAAVHWYRARLTAGVHRLRVAFASPRTPRVRLSLLDDDARPAAHLVDTQLSGAAIGTGAVVTPASPPARAALEGRLAADDAFLGDLLAAVLLARSRRDGVSEGELLDRAARVAARTDHGPLVDLQRVTWRLQSWTGDDPGTNQRAARGLLAEADGLPLARVFRRVLNLRQQRYEDADNDLDQLIEDAGHDPRVISMWLDHALNNGWAAEAEATLDRLVYAIPESPALVDRRLDVLKTLDRFEDTAQVLEELASADPWYPGLVEELAVSCRPDLALAVLQQREKTGVVDFATDMGRLQLLTETGETAAAENQLQACRHRWGQLPVLDRYALELSASEGDEAVLQAARAAVERSPHQMELWELLWRLSRVQNDNRLAAFRTTHLFDGLRGGLGELVDIGTRPRPCGFRGHRGDDFAVDHRRNPVDRCDHRDRRLAPAGHHIDVHLVEIGIQIDRRNGEGADGGRRQVDHLFAVLLQHLIVPPMRPRRRGIEHDADVFIFRQLHKPLDALMRGRHIETCRAGQTIGRRVDPNHRGHIQHLGIAHDLDHQIGADVARPDDGTFDLFHSLIPLQKRHGRSPDR